MAFLGQYLEQNKKKIKSPSHSPKNALCEQNFKITTNFPPKMQSQLEKNVVCKRALSERSKKNKDEA